MFFWDLSIGSLAVEMLDGWLLYGLSVPGRCGDMEITWIGHSSLRPRTNEATLVTDLYADSVGFVIGRYKADIVTISNDHLPHFHRGALQGDPRFIVGTAEYEIADFYITGMGTC